jgi:hypothetical protein
VQGFERAQDIVAALRIQFAHLTSEGLQWRKKLLGRPLLELRGLQGEALRLALEKPKAWEYLLFGRVLSDEVEAAGDLLREHEMGLLLGPGEQPPKGGMERWMNARLSELSNIVESADYLVNNGLPIAFGEPGVPGDVEEIVFVARRLGATYRHAVEWSQRLRRAHVDEGFEALVREMARFSDSTIKRLGELGPTFLQQVEDALANPPGPEEGPRVIDMKLTFELSNMEGYRKEIREVMKGYG